MRGMPPRRGLCRLLGCLCPVAATSRRWCLTKTVFELSGVLEADGGGQERLTSDNVSVYITCHEWAIRPATPIESCRLQRGSVVLAEQDSLVVTVKEALARSESYTAELPFPSSYTVAGYQRFEVQFLTEAVGSHVRLEYTCSPRLGNASENRSNLDYLETVLVVCAMALMGSLACACSTYVLCLMRANHRLGRAIESSRLLVYSEVALNQQQRRQAQQEERTMEMLVALPVRAWTGLEEGQDQDQGPIECCLCLEAYEPNSKIRVLPCEHFFHQACIDTWFQTRRFLPRTCPLCKRNPAPSAAARASSQESEGQLPDGAPAQERWAVVPERALPGADADTRLAAAARGELPLVVETVSEPASVPATSVETVVVHPLAPTAYGREEASSDEAGEPC